MSFARCAPVRDDQIHVAVVVQIIGAGERVLRSAPPLVISDAHITEGIDVTRRLIATAERYPISFGPSVRLERSSEVCSGSEPPDVQIRRWCRQ